MQIETEKMIADIIQKEMGLDNTQIWIYNQDFKMPTTKGLFVVVGYEWSKTISNRNSTQIDEDGDLVEVQDCNVLEHIGISAMSQNAEARQRKSEVLNALASIYAQQKCEANSCRIGRIPSSFINVADAEGATNINRFNITIPVYVWYQKIKEISTGYGADYYDDFTGSAIIENKEIDLTEIKGD